MSWTKLQNVTKVLVTIIVLHYNILHIEHLYFPPDLARIMNQDQPHFFHSD